MEIQNRRIEDIKPYERNPRRNDGAVKYVAESIKQFGFKVPIVLDKHNVIVCGHTRYEAAKLLGMADLPCVVADDLTPKQIKAFRLADNKVAEKAEWDFDLLDDELADLEDDFDFEALGFEFEDPDDFDFKEKKDAALQTDEKYNLPYFDEYRCEGRWQMPKLMPCDYVPKRLIGFNYAMSSSDYDAGIHFYLDDYQFERVWSQPQRYIEILQRYDCVLTPSYSLYMNMAEPIKVCNVFRSRLLGQMMQDYGLKVIPIVYWAGKESFEYCFDGLPENSTLSTLTMGTKNPEVWGIWKMGMDELIKRKHPKRILLYGNGLSVDYDFGDIEVIYYQNEVTERMKK